MTDETKKLNPAELAVKVAGSQEKLAEAVEPKVTRQAVAAWCKAGKIPADRVPAVSRVTGIEKAILNPIFAE